MPQVPPEERSPALGLRRMTSGDSAFMCWLMTDKFCKRHGSVSSSSCTCHRVYLHFPRWASYASELYYITWFTLGYSCELCRLLYAILAQKCLLTDHAKGTIKNRHHELLSCMIFLCDHGGRYDSLMTYATWLFIFPITPFDLLSAVECRWSILYEMSCTRLKRKLKSGCSHLEYMCKF